MLINIWGHQYFRSTSVILLVPSNLYACRTVPTAMSALTYTSCAYLTSSQECALTAPLVSIAARAVSIFADGTVVVFTWLKTYRVFVLTRGITSRTNYSALILRDGTLYFLSVPA